MMVEFAGRGRMVLHEFDDELRFAEFLETMWPCARTTRIRANVEREREKTRASASQGEEQGSMTSPWAASGAT
jgi:hypothetical protein